MQCAMFKLYLVLDNCTSLSDKTMTNAPITLREMLSATKAVNRPDKTNITV